MKLRKLAGVDYLPIVRAELLGPPLGFVLRNLANALAR
jgi:hypothetical protein